MKFKTLDEIAEDLGYDPAFLRKKPANKIVQRARRIFVSEAKAHGYTCKEITEWLGYKTKKHPIIWRYYYEDYG